MSGNKNCRGYDWGLNPGPCLSSTLLGKSYCQEHQKDFECRGCKKELETSPGGKERFYKVIKTFEDKEDNFWKESDSFSLCSCCWEQKKEDLKKDLKKKYIPMYEKQDEIKEKTEVRESINYVAVNQVILNNCLICKKWNDNSKHDHYHVVDGWKNGCCSKKCQDERVKIDELAELAQLEKQEKEGYFTENKRLQELKRKYSNNNQSRVQQYFTKNNIKSIRLEGDEIVFGYNDSQIETKLINTSELQQIQAYCQAHNLNTLSFSDLQSQTQAPKPFNWKSPWVIGGGIVLVVGMILVVYWFKNNKKNKE